MYKNIETGSASAGLYNIYLYYTQKIVFLASCLSLAEQAINHYRKQD